MHTHMIICLIAIVQFRFEVSINTSNVHRALFWSAIRRCLVHKTLVLLINLGYFYSSSSSDYYSPNTARILCRSFVLKRHRQLQVKDLPKVPTWQLEWDSNS